MGRLNKKLTLKNKKTAKALSKAVHAEKDPVEEAKAPSKLLLNVASIVANSKLSLKSVTEKPSGVIPTKLSKITKKEKRKIRSDGLKDKLTLMASEKLEAKGVFPFYNWDQA